MLFNYSLHSAPLNFNTLSEIKWTLGKIFNLGFLEFIDRLMFRIFLNPISKDITVNLLRNFWIRIFIS